MVSPGKACWNVIFSNLNLFFDQVCFCVFAFMFVKNSTPWRNDAIELKISENVMYSMLCKWFQLQNHVCVDQAAPCEMFQRLYK